MNAQLKSVISLLLICVISAGLLSVVNMITAPVIDKNLADKASGAMREVLPEGSGFQPVDLSQYTLPATITEAYSTENGAGYVFKLTTKGYESGLVIMCGISADGKVVGTKVVTSKETPNIGGKAMDALAPQLVGATADTIVSVDTVAGATFTTAAFRDAVKDAINASIILGGGSVDIRTEEEILLDNQKAALPEGGEVFTVLFVPEALVGIDMVYVAENGAGYVLVIGETFVGIDTTGTIVGEVDEATRAIVEPAATLIISSEMTEMDIADLKASGVISKRVRKAFVTTTGNYVLEMMADGYGTDEYAYHASGLPIIFRIAISPDGTILACETLSQGESKGFGDKCATPGFYTQFVGKDVSNYTEVVISGATITTRGYQEAVLAALNAIDALKGAGE